MPSKFNWDVILGTAELRRPQEITAFADQATGRTTRIEDIDMKGTKLTVRTAESQVIKATAEQLRAFTRDELRYYAKGLGVERGQDKEDTIRNLLASGKATFCAMLGN